MIRPLVALYLACVAVRAQTAPSKPQFEVATIKVVATGAPFQGMSISGLQETTEERLFRCDNCPLSMLINLGFQLRPNQYSGPAWANMIYFTVAAKVPRNTDAGQCLELLRELLIERFGLKFHYEKKETRGYQMVIAAAGLKI